MALRLGKFFKIFFGAVALLISVFLIWGSFQYVVPVLMYHRVLDIDGKRSDTVSNKSFETQMRYLNKYRYNVIGTDELVEGIRAGVKFPRNTVVVTFDDGFVDNFDNAYPIMKKYGITATFFVPSDDIGKDGFMTKANIDQMIKDGFTLGSHTLTHKYLPNESIESQAREIIDSKIALEEMFDVSINHIAYPVGGFTEDSKRLVKEAGYKSAFTTNRGYDRDNKDVYELNRIKMSDKDNSDFLIFWKLTGHFTMFKSPKAPY